MRQVKIGSKSCFAIKKLFDFVSQLFSKATPSLNIRPKIQNPSHMNSFKTSCFALKHPVEKDTIFFGQFFDKIIPLAQSALVNTTTILYFNPL